MYEAGNDSAFETLVTSDDFTDLLSKAEYVQNVHSYDRKQLQEYVETKQQISDLKDSLEKDQKELESKQAEYEKQGDNLNNLITSKSAEVVELLEVLAIYLNSKRSLRVEGDLNTIKRAIRSNPPKLLDLYKSILVEMIYLTSESEALDVYKHFSEDRFDYLVLKYSSYMSVN